MLNLVKDAYDKLKSYVYYDNFSLDLRVKLAIYEHSVESNLERMAGELEIYASGRKSEYIEDLIGKIKVREMPKKLKPIRAPDQKEIFYISNISKKDEYICEQITHFIDCAVDIHIISFLWILEIGCSVDGKLSDECYAYRPVKPTSKRKVWFKKIFSRYYEKYHYWRDSALKAAEELHSRGEDVAIVSLDIKSFYDSVDLDLTTFLDDSFEDHFLNDILAQIHEKYREKRRRKNKLLPIGLVSSGMLANFILHPLDLEVSSKIKPAYYGRYVDDFLLVISDPVIKESDPTLFIDKLFVDKGILSKRKSEYIISSIDGNLCLQKEKLKLYHFKSSEPISLLDEFRKTIQKNSSEFRHLPEVDTMFDDFTSKSLNITYSDTVNKIRSIEGVSHDKYGASKHLANILFILKYTNSIDENLVNSINKQVKEFFVGQRSIEFNSLWEKVFSVFTINKDLSQVVDFFDETLKAILCVTTNRKTTDVRLKNTLIRHLYDSLAMSVALDFPSFKNAFFIQLDEVVGTRFEKKDVKFRLLRRPSKIIRSRAKRLINSNLFRHNSAQYPLLSLCHQHDSFSFRDPLIAKNTRFEFSRRRMKYYPRFISYHELRHFFNLKSLFKPSANPLSHEKVFQKFSHINRINMDSNIDQFPSENEMSKRMKFIDIPSTSFSKCKISIVNIKVNEKNSKLNYLKKANLSYDRMSELNHVLNLSIKERADIIVFPEISIPFQWLDHLSDFSKRHDVAIICGVEHISNKKDEVFNYSATILPFNHGGFKNVLTDLRLKVDYSPEEIVQIEGDGFKVPDQVETEFFRIYKWKGCLFTVFNCFELADIKKRACFRGEVDFVIFIEHNKDTKYFSNITESTSRDIHAYVVQVNSSHYGDCRITQPSKSHLKDIVRIKGGLNTTIITGKIDILDLRKFQGQDYSSQKDHAYLKQTPPRYESSSERKIIDS